MSVQCDALRTTHPYMKRYSRDPEANEKLRLMTTHEKDGSLRAVYYQKERIFHWHAAINDFLDELFHMLIFFYPFHSFTSLWDQRITRISFTILCFLLAFSWTLVLFEAEWSRIYNIYNIQILLQNTIVYDERVHDFLGYHSTGILWRKRGDSIFLYTVFTERQLSSMFHLWRLEDGWLRGDD